MQSTLPPNIQQVMLKGQWTEESAMRCVNSWLKLAASPGLAPTSKVHFKRLAARAMRQVLVEAARRRNAVKRGDGAVAVTFDEALAHPATRPEELLALDEALVRLHALEPRQAQMVEGRFFGGLDIPEIAELLDVSEATVLRDWRAARAWLTVALAADR